MHLLEQFDTRNTRHNKNKNNKRSRDDALLEAADDYGVRGFSDEAGGIGIRGPASPAKQQVPKIKLSLKLGSVRRHMQPEPLQQQQPLSPLTATTNETVRYSDDYDKTNQHSDEEPVDVGDAADYNGTTGTENYGISVSRRPSQADTPSQPAQTMTPGEQADSTSGSATPRIRLRFSLKAGGASTLHGEETANAGSALQQPQQQPKTLKKTWSQARNTSWHDEYAVSHQPSPLATGFSSAVPGSPVESVGSNASSGYSRRVSEKQATYSPPSITSDIDSDAETNAGDEHLLPRTPLSAGAARIQRGAAPRRRGRPPLRGKESFSTMRAGARPLTTPRVAGAAAAATTVTLKSSLVRLITRIRKRDSYGFFLEPVNTRAIPDYLDVIKRPMDLGTIRRKVEGGLYSGIAEFRQDVKLVCENARKYNGVGSIYARTADIVLAYATAAIDREEAKLERVGQATVSVRTAGGGSIRDPDSLQGSLYGSPRSHSPSGSVSPHHDSFADELSDSRLGSGDGRRSSRRRWRGMSEPHQQQQQQLVQSLVDATPASIIDNFRWTGTRRKSRRVMAVPKRTTESQARIAVVADGSIDPSGFEEDLAHISFETGSVCAPLVAASASTANAFFAYGRYFAPATYSDYGPGRSKDASSSANGGGDLGEPFSGAHFLQPIHGDTLGMAYWCSMSSFIEGAGSDVVQYASSVMGHLTDGGYAAASTALRFMSKRDTDASEASPTADSVDSADGLLGDVDLPELVAWLDSRHQRDQLYAQRVDALARQMSLHDISARLSADSHSDTARPCWISESQKQQMFTENTQKLKVLHERRQQGESFGAGTGNGEDSLESLESSIYTLSEQMCLALTKSKLPSAQIPGLRRPIQRPPRPAAPPLQPLQPAASARPHYGSAGLRATGAKAKTPIAPRGTAIVPPPRQNRTVSTPSLPMLLHPASLASTVQSDLISKLAAHDNDSD
ncbi:hypothetical protein H4217_006006 [Coemansia sp. RSA 1939]|nr:hypothetical protein H4217_006006 [Coemansia sp. RSA 1939]